MKLALDGAGKYYFVEQPKTPEMFNVPAISWVDFKVSPCQVVQIGSSQTARMITIK